MFTAVIRFPMPPEALQIAARIETTREMLSALPLCSTIDFSCVVMRVDASRGSWEEMSSTCLATVAGDATSPYREISAISAGNTARKLKNATPPPMIGMLSALFSAHARLRICFQPFHGICVGFSAWMPGSSAGLGAPGGGVPGSRAGGAAAALAASALRAAFSSTRSRIRSTALSRGLVPVTWVLLGSVARPGAGEPLEAARTGPVYRRLGGREDRALDRGGDHDLGHRVLALQRARGVVLLRHDLPDLLEHDPGQGARQDPADQSDRPVGELQSLAQRFLLVPRAARFLRKITTTATSPASARPT